MPRVKLVEPEKPPRGFGKGRRGPAKTKAELEKKKGPSPDRVVVIDETRNFPVGESPLEKYNASRGIVGSEAKTQATRAVKANRDLQRLIREIGEEVIDPQTGWTRTVAVIRRLYADAMMGKTQAQALLFERGWGKPIVPVQVDVRTELRQIVVETGLSQDDIDNDPVLRELFTTVEGNYRELPDGNADPGNNRMDESSSKAELVRSLSLSSGESDELLRPSTVVEDGGRL